MMYYEPLDSIPLWVFFVAACATTGIALECGWRLGRWSRLRNSKEEDPSVGAIVGAVLGLLAFMLAFTFSMAASRFDSRRQAVLDEANAIGTTYLRARLLPDPQRSEVARLLREYVGTRLRAVKEREERNLAEAVAHSETLQEQLWSQATAAAEKNANPITGLFLQSLNEVIDLHAARIQIAMRSRIPLSIWCGLFALAFVGMVSTGYQAGLSVTRRTPAMLLLVVAFAGVLFLIADLDRSQEGFLRVNQGAMVDLQKSMQPPQPRS